MTITEWTASTDPQPMLAWLHAQGKLNDRKARLFAVAFCRSVWSLLPDRRSRKAVETSELFADGIVDANKLKAVWGDARWAAQVASRKEDPSSGIKWLVAFLMEQDICREALLGRFSAHWVGQTNVKPQPTTLLRDIFGNPFRLLPPLKPSLLTPRVLDLARAVYEERVMPHGTFDPEKLVALADELRHSGCQDEAMLDHLREPKALHVRGCWVVDRILDRE